MAAKRLASPKNVFLMVRTTAEERADWKAQAANNGFDLSNYVRELIENDKK